MFFLIQIYCNNILVPALLTLQHTYRDEDDDDVFFWIVWGLSLYLGICHMILNVFSLGQKHSLYKRKYEAIQREIWGFITQTGTYRIMQAQSISRTQSVSERGKSVTPKNSWISAHGGRTMSVHTSPASWLEPMSHRQTFSLLYERITAIDAMFAEADHELIPMQSSTNHGNGAGGGAHMIGQTPRNTQEPSSNAQQSVGDLKSVSSFHIPQHMNVVYHHGHPEHMETIRDIESHGVSQDGSHDIGGHTYQLKSRSQVQAEQAEDTSG